MMEGLGQQGAAGEEGPLLGAVATASSPQVLMGHPLDADFMESLPLPLAVKYRVYALKKLQAKSAGLEAKYLREFHSIERRFAGIYGPLLEKRRQIINALYEPTKEECEVKSKVADCNEVADDSEAQMHCPEENLEYEDLEEQCGKDLEEVQKVFGEYGGMEGHNIDEDKEDPKGIPDFWLRVLKNVQEVTHLIKKYDEPILKLLRDVKVKFSKPNEPLAFTLEFHFEPNDYFTNEVLTKTYLLKSKLDYSDPHPFRGSAVEHCIGCKIDWKEGKNVTVQTVLKKQRHRVWGLVRTTTQELPRESFFNFFSALRWGLNADEDEEDVFIAHTLRTFVIPRAVLYFTGEALEAEQEGMVRECNNPASNTDAQENWVAAVDGAKVRDRGSQPEDVDR